MGARAPDPDGAPVGAGAGSGRRLGSGPWGWRRGSTVERWRRGRAAASTEIQGRGHRTQPRGRRPRRERAGVVAGWRVLGVGRGCSGVAGAGGIRWSHRRRQGLGATAGAVRGHGAVSAQRTRPERVNRGRARRGPRRRARAREGEEGSKAGLTSGGVGHGQWGARGRWRRRGGRRRWRRGSRRRGPGGGVGSGRRRAASGGRKASGGERRGAAPIWIGGGCRGERRNRGGEWGVRLGFLGVGACVGQGWGLGRPGGVAGWAGWVGPVGPRPRGVSLFFCFVFIYLHFCF